MKTCTLGILALLTITASVAAIPAASASGGWSCSGDPDTVEVCTANELWWPSDCALEVYVMGHGTGFCYRFA